MSVFAQNLEYVSNALRVLKASSNNQYGIRGQPPVDMVRTGRVRVRLWIVGVGGFQSMAQATTSMAFVDSNLLTW